MAGGGSIRRADRKIKRGWAADTFVEKTQSPFLFFRAICQGRIDYENKRRTYLGNREASTISQTVCPRSM